MHRRKLARWEKCTAAASLLAISAALYACGATLVSRNMQQAKHDGETRGDNQADDTSPLLHQAGEFHEPLQIVADIPGVADPTFANAVSTTLLQSDEVIGIVVGEKAFAFSRRAMHTVNRHIIHLEVDDRPICVTYCDMVDRARVLSRPSGGELIDLRVGGRDMFYQLVFLLDGTRYGQSSPDLPLDDIPFERTTLANWVSRYPDSMIYEG